VPQTLVDKKISETVTAQKQPGPENVIINKISVFPNPVTNGYVRISFEDQPAGKYQIQFMDISGKMISTQDVTVNGKLQVETFSHPRLMSRGNYMLKVVNQSTQEAITSKILVQ
ncbi:MAG TPA: T9SS type A sorting domain-containing protein, partial [Chitinophagaceae bacterium]